MTKRTMKVGEIEISRRVESQLAETEAPQRGVQVPQNGDQAPQIGDFAPQKELTD